MITRWGMGELGTLAFETDEEQPFLGYELARGRDYSEATAAQINEEVRHLLAERYQTVCRLLTGSRDRLDALAEALLHDETLDHDQLVKILGTRVKLPQQEAVLA